MSVFLAEIQSVRSTASLCQPFMNGNLPLPGVLPHRSQASLLFSVLKILAGSASELPLEAFREIRRVCESYRIHDFSHCEMALFKHHGSLLDADIPYTVHRREACKRLQLSGKLLGGDTGLFGQERYIQLRTADILLYYLYYVRKEFLVRGHLPRILGRRTGLRQGRRPSAGRYPRQCRMAHSAGRYAGS